MEPTTGLKIMYLSAFVGAGIVGAITLLMPGLAAKYVFAGAVEVNVYMRILGSVWLALGALAMLGLQSPMAYIPILLIQLAYKSAWLVFAAYPALLAGNRETGLIFLTVLFTVWVYALLMLVPIRASLPVHA
ncbi:MAG: hypothetical protein AAF993_18285 [Pseudomonadota bacterium]